MNRLLDRRKIKEVVVVLAGSRTGSSFLFDQLASSGQLLCPQGEETPYYRLAGIGNYNSEYYSDEISLPPSEAILNQAGELILADSGLNSLEVEDYELFFQHLLFRAKLRFPHLLFSEGSLAASLVKNKLEENRNSWNKLFPSLWKSLAALSKDLEIRGLDPNGSPLIEEQPWIDPIPKVRVIAENIDKYPLLIKTSTNCFRTPLIRAMYPNANFRWIHLRRNPAATISALVDGWLSPYFQSYRMPQSHLLSIKGYTDRVQDGDRFWKFDLPPGWEEYRNRDLFEVCSFQFQASSEAIAQFRKNCKDPILDVSYENLCGPRSQELLNEILQFAVNREVTPRTFFTKKLSATVSAPEAGKWKKRKTEIEFYVKNFNNGVLLKIAADGNYPTERITEWS